MEFLFQLLVWALFGYLSYKGFVFGLIGLGCLGVYAFFKIKKQYS